MRRAITIQEARELSAQIMKNAEQRRIDSQSCDEPPAIDTWTSGKILPVPSDRGDIVEEFLAIRSDSESISIETFWHDMSEWRDADDNILQISAWRRIPMDGIDAAVAEGDRE